MKTYILVIDGKIFYLLLDEEDEELFLLPLLFLDDLLPLPWLEDPLLALLKGPENFPEEEEPEHKDDEPVPEDFDEDDPLELERELLLPLE